MKISGVCTSRQTDFGPQFRAVVVDWLVLVHEKLHQPKEATQETLFLCVSVLDRYLHAKTISRGKVQLAAIAGELERVGAVTRARVCQ
jgi:hypothetical protein